LWRKREGGDGKKKKRGIGFRSSARNRAAKNKKKKKRGFWIRERGAEG